jgi:hypothetical protein
VFSLSLSLSLSLDLNQLQKSSKPPEVPENLKTVERERWSRDLEKKEMRGRWLIYDTSS